MEKLECSQQIPIFVLYHVIRDVSLQIPATKTTARLYEEQKVKHKNGRMSQ
jgi:hypothetical protein